MINRPNPPDYAARLRRLAAGLVRTSLIEGFQAVSDLEGGAAEIDQLRIASRTRPDTPDFRCGACGAPHNIDTSIPSETWNAIARGPLYPPLPNDALCVLCIDERMFALGLSGEAKFYFVGRALRSVGYELAAQVSDGTTNEPTERRDPS